MPKTAMTTDRFANQTLLFTAAAASCLATVYVTPEHPTSAAFGLIGYLGGLLFVATGSHLNLMARPGLTITARLLGGATIVALLLFLIGAVAVAGSPTVGEPTFDPDAWFLRFFACTVRLLQWLGIAAAVYFCYAAAQGWAGYFERRQPRYHAGGPPRWLGVGLAASVMLYFAYGCFVTLPGYVVPPMLRVVSLGLLVGLEWASWTRVKDQRAVTRPATQT
ncbi:MAG: hypothetical protein AAGF97_17080 [Planctomycetota bacterium]